MPASNLDPKALARLTPGQIADLALQADQEARAARKAGNIEAALRFDEESVRLAAAFQLA